MMLASTAAAAPDPHDVASHLAKIIGADTKGRGVPRRAVVTSCGRVAEKADVCDGKEIRVLSEVCEVVQRSKGIPVFPRGTNELVAMCLGTNASGAWEALFRDMKTNDVDWSMAAEMLFGGGGAGSADALVQCFLSAPTSTHMLYIAHCILHLLDRAAPEQMMSFASALAERMPDDLIAAMTAHCTSIRRETRDSMLASIARLLSKVNIPVGPMTEALVGVLKTNRTDLVNLFVHLPVAQFVEHRPDLVDLLLARCGKVAPANRYPLLALLAHVVNTMPDVMAVPQRQEPLAAIVHTTMEAFCKSKPTSLLDARTLFVSSMLAGKIVDPALVNPNVFHCLAHGLFHCSGSLIQQQQQHGAK